jgi:hypothetical protein
MSEKANVKTHKSMVGNCVYPLLYCGDVKFHEIH